MSHCNIAVISLILPHVGTQQPWERVCQGSSTIFNTTQHMVQQCALRHALSKAAASLKQTLSPPLARHQNITIFPPRPYRVQTRTWCAEPFPLVLTQRLSPSAILCKDPVHVQVYMQTSYSDVQKRGSSNCPRDHAVSHQHEVACNAIHVDGAHNFADAHAYMQG